MAHRTETGNRALWIAIIVMAPLFAIALPSFLLAAICFTISALLLKAAVGKRIPVKNQSTPILPEEIEARGINAVVPGAGDIYLRVVCSCAAALLLTTGIYLILSAFTQ